MRINRFLKHSLAAGVASAGLASVSVHAYGPLYIFDYASGTPYRWDVTSPVPVYTDGGNFASGTVRVRDPELDTCNTAGGWICSYELYVEFSNQQGVTKVAEELASWSSVPTSSFQAEVAGSFHEIGIGGDDGDITGAAEEFDLDGNGNVVHEIVGAVNNGGIHVIFDEDGSVMANVIGAPPGVLGIATPEWADERTGVITEGWAVIGGAGTYYNDAELEQMGGVITHELGHSFNLAHTQTNGHVVMYGDWAVTTTGPVDCSAHPAVGGEYRLPYPQTARPTPENMAVMYPFIDNNPGSWSGPTGVHQASVDTAEDYAAISSIYPAPNFHYETGSVTGTVTYPFSRDGVIGVNIVARNLDNPFEDAISVMSGDWNDGVGGAAQGAGAFTLAGLTPGARYAIHAENIFAGGFPTPQANLPGPSEYWNGPRESDDANADDACDYQPLSVSGGDVVDGVDIQMNGQKKALRLVINPAPNGNNITEDGLTTAGDIINTYGAAQSWVYHEGREEYSILPMGGIRLSDNGSVIAGRVLSDEQYLPARKMPGNRIEIIPTPGNNACDQGGGIDEYYSNFAISPDGRTMGGFLWNCDNVAERRNFIVSAATYSDSAGWTILNDHLDELSSRVNALANDSTAVGWSATPGGWWEGRVWKNGVELNLLDAAPDHITDIGEATGVSADGSMVVGINSWDDQWNQRGYTYNTVTGELDILDIYEECPWWDWFCFGAKPFNPYDIADDGTMVGAIGTASGAGAMIVSDIVGAQRLVDFLKDQGVINANDLSVASSANRISSNGRHITGWTAVDGYFGSFKLTLDQLYICRDGRTQQVGYPGAVTAQLKKGATLGMCEADLPLQYRGNF